MNQTHKDYQLLVIDDASEDDTVKIIKQYYNKFQDIDIIEKKANRGLADSLNIGINESKHEIIIRHDSEDISHKNRIGILLNEYQNNPEISGITSACFLLYGNYNFTGYAPVIKLRCVNMLLDLNRNRIYHASVLLNKNHVIEAGYYPNLRASQDYALWKRMRTMKMRFKFIDKPLYAYFREESGISSAYSNDLQLINRYAISKKKLSVEKIKRIQDRQAVKNQIVYNLPFKSHDNKSTNIYFRLQKYLNKYNMFRYRKYINGFMYKQ